MVDRWTQKEMKHFMKRFDYIKSKFSHLLRANVFLTKYFITLNGLKYEVIGYYNPNFGA
jgi:hypothetical protein